MRAIKGAFAWLVDQAIEHWLPITVAIFAGGGMTYAAMVTEWINRWGPIAWASIGLFGFLAAFIGTAFGRHLLAKASANTARAALEEALAQRPVQINILETHFRRQWIRLVDIFLPYAPVIDGKHFEHCDLVGPAAVVLLNGTRIQRCNFLDCTFIKVTPKPTDMVQGVIGAQNCAFTDCRFYQVTFLVVQSVIDSLKADMPGMPIIGD